MDTEAAAAESSGAPDNRTMLQVMQDKRKATEAANAAKM